METTETKLKKPTKKKSSETGVWFLVIDHDWGTRGVRRTSEYFFRSKPTPARIKEIVGSAHYTLTRKRCSTPYSSSSYH
jgi:hypothetical protein